MSRSISLPKVLPILVAFFCIFHDLGMASPAAATAPPDGFGPPQPNYEFSSAEWLQSTYEQYEPPSRTIFNLRMAAQRLFRRRATHERGMQHACS